MSSDIAKDRAEAIFKENSNYVFRVALFLTRSKELADDITQETFIQVFRKYHTFDCSKPIKPWIYKITVNVTRNVLRKQKWLQLFGQVPENGCSDLVEDAVLRSEEEHRLWSEINNLNFKNREIVILHFYAGMKLKEIAESLEIPLGTCKSRLNSALKALRKRLSNNEFEFLTKGGGTCETI